MMRNSHRFKIYGLAIILTLKLSGCVLVMNHVSAQIIEDISDHVLSPVGRENEGDSIIIDTEQERFLSMEQKKAGPHKGCKLLLKDSMDPQPSLVGSAFEAASMAMGATLDYHVETEAGPTSAVCMNGMAGGYPCNNVDLLSLIPLANFGATKANDIWGWTDSLSGREFAIIGLREGTAFVEITNPFFPINLGVLPTKTHISSWRDIKTLGNYALIVSEASDHGMQVFDLTQLLSASPLSTFSETKHYGEFSNAHNIFVNEDTAYAYAVGTNTCSGGLHIIDLTDPLNPVFAGCYSDDGYTHDVQCVVYNGPDEYLNREICFASNEDTITIIDVSDKNNMVQLARKSYAGDKYTHQGWLTEDHSHFIFDDELDEYSKNVRTRTHVFDVSVLTNPVYKGYHEGRSKAIDHNLYVVGDLVYQANYRAGLNILKIKDVNSVDFEEAGYFDIYPADDARRFNGAWSNYPFFPSGVVVVSGIEQGLFVLGYNDNGETSQPSPSTTSTPTASTTAPIPSPAQEESVTWGLDRIDQRSLPLDEAYNSPYDGSDVTVFVIDTGIHHTHDEFRDSSGRLRARQEKNFSGDSKNFDCHGHGTHVAGTIGGKLYGVAKNVKIVGVKVLDCVGGGSWTNVIQGIDWVRQHAQENGINGIVNLSLSGGTNVAVDAAVQRLHDSGIPTVVAAGNFKQDACYFSPARVGDAITVASTTRIDSRSDFSNYGSCVDIFAPGSDITSAWIGSNSVTHETSGTSMAAPHVSGALALLLQEGFSAAEAVAEMLNRATMEVISNEGNGSNNKLLFIGEMGSTNPPTPPPPTVAPTPCSSASLILEILTDRYPMETEYTLTNTCTNELVLKRERGSLSGRNKSYIFDECVPFAEYKFTITDSYGDGICCEYGSGGYKIFYDEILVAFGGSFSQKAEVTFGACPTTAPSTSLPLPPTLNPTTPPTKNPTSHPTTITPTIRPTTIAPTMRPTTIAPTMHPTTMAPTMHPTTIAPTSKSPTHTPTKSSVSSAPTKVAATVAPAACPSVSIQVEIVTDDRPRETSWDLKNNEGIIIERKEPGYYTLQNTKYIDTVCLSDGEASQRMTSSTEGSERVSFTIKDSGGDGIGDGGGYTVAVNGEESIISGGGDFGAEESKEINIAVTKWETVFRERFDDGKGLFSYGRGKRVLTVNSMSGEKEFSMKLKNKQWMRTGLLSPDNFDMANPRLRVEFYFLADVERKNSNDSFDLQIKDAEFVKGWQQVATWREEDGVMDGSWHKATVIFDAPTPDFRLQFKISTNKGVLYFDNISLSKHLLSSPYPTPTPTKAPSTSPTHLHSILEEGFENGKEYFTGGSGKIVKNQGGNDGRAILVNSMRHIKTPWIEDALNAENDGVANPRMKINFSFSFGTDEGVLRLYVKFKKKWELKGTFKSGENGIQKNSWHNGKTGDISTSGETKFKVLFMSYHGQVYLDNISIFSIET